MNSNTFISCLILLISLICIVIALPAKPTGKYTQNPNEGKYISNNKGKYVVKAYPYVHNDDKRHLGKYMHIHIPYNGGYGPYSGMTIPYVHDEHGDYSIQTVSIDGDNYDNIFNQNQFEIPKPEIPLEYGFPEYSSNKQ